MLNPEDINLVLFFTRGMSLDGWARGGLIDRELLLYQRLLSSLAGISLVTYGGAEEKPHRLRLDGMRLYYNSLGLHPRLYPWYMSRFLRLPLDGPAVFKSNQLPGAEIGLKVAARHKKPFIARCGYPYSLNVEAAQGENSAQAKRARRLEGRVFRRADRIVVTTEYIRQRLAERHKLDPQRFTVLPNFVDETVFCPRNETVKPGCLGFVGRLSPEKNLDAVIRALADTELQLEVVGEGPCMDQLRELADKMRARVYFWGWVPNAELPRLMNTWQAYIQTSFYEGHPKSVVEAMSCGLPVIGSRVRGIEHVLEHGRTGLLCGTDFEEIRAAVDRLMGDDALRQRLGAQAREFVMQNYALPLIAGRELEIIRETAR